MDVIQPSRYYKTTRLYFLYAAYQHFYNMYQIIFRFHLYELTFLLGG